jgi:hypothetical protein
LSKAAATLLKIKMMKVGVMTMMMMVQMGMHGERIRRRVMDLKGMVNVPTEKVPSCSKLLLI